MMIELLMFLILAALTFLFFLLHNVAVRVRVLEDARVSDMRKIQDALEAEELARVLS